jgi:FAD/FMN-containing dehydrogenase
MGFDPVSRLWIAEAHAQIERPPRLDGMLLTDPSSLASYADDVGNAIRNTPIAVLLPASVQDVQKMLRFAKQRGIKVAARGQGHTTFGQSQVRGGLVIDMRTLNQIHAIEPLRAEVDAGLTWRELVERSVPLGLTPPVLTGYISLTIGGTLSVGGVSSSYNKGVQVDHVKELELVTGTGELLRCSERENQLLFEAALAGLGQYGIITRAVVNLVPAKTTARVFALSYDDATSFFRDMRRLLRRGEFDDLFNIGVPNSTGNFGYELTAVKFFNAGEEPDPNSEFLLRGLGISPTAARVIDMPYIDYVLRVDVVIELFQSIGLFDDVLHPWFDVWLPDSTVEDYVGPVVSALKPEDVGSTGFLLLFPQRRDRMKRRFFRVPECAEWVWLFDILTAAEAPGPNPVFQRQMEARNRALFEKARRAGGTRYPIGTLPFNRTDWQQHYGSTFGLLSALKRRFDPAGILTPGPGIF